MSEELLDGISLVVIAYNEETMIERCLQSVQGVVDEIIVLHDGECRDRTLELARRYTDKVIVSQHKGVAEHHNIEVLQYVTRKWLLKLDADEFLSDGLRVQMADLVRDESVDAYAFIWQYWNGKCYITQGVPYKPALFRMSGIAAVEFLSRNYSTDGVIKNVPLLLEHQPAYNNYTCKTFDQKWKKWIRIQAGMTLDYPNTRFYNYSPERVQAFEDYMKAQLRLAHPLLLPGWFAYSFFKFVMRLRVWRNLLALHIPFYMGGYAALLCWYIWQGKRKQA